MAARKYVPILVHAVHCAEEQVVQCNSAVLATNRDVVLTRANDMMIQLSVLEDPIRLPNCGAPDPRVMGGNGAELGAVAGIERRRVVTSTTRKEFP